MPTCTRASPRARRAVHAQRSSCPRCRPGASGSSRSASRAVSARAPRGCRAVDSLTFAGAHRDRAAPLASPHPRARAHALARLRSRRAAAQGGQRSAADAARRGHAAAGARTDGTGGRFGRPASAAGHVRRAQRAAAACERPRPVKGGGRASRRAAGREPPARARSDRHISSERREGARPADVPANRRGADACPGAFVPPRAPRRAPRRAPPRGRAARCL